MSRTNWEKEFKDCLEYIEKYWEKIILHPDRLKINRQIITIPNSFIVPNDKKFSFIFYWDSYFMFQGLIDTKRAYITKGMVENFAYLFEKYHVIPNFNAESSLGRSQPPLFTSMILNAYEINPDKKWLAKLMDVAIREYTHVWIDKDRHYHHSVSEFNLQRYGDRDLGYDHSSELESGWDMTSRFYNRASTFLPIDLNVYLYKYEKDFAESSKILGDTRASKEWEKIAEKRIREIKKLMWNQKAGFFFDYNYAFKRQSVFYSLAGFTPLWAGLATKAQAKKMVKKLPLFETDFGLTITAKESLAPKISLSQIPIRYRPAIEGILKPKQWDYPNIWPPLEFLTVMGLLRYGYIQEAKRIMEKSIRAHANLFKKHKTFFEKINGRTGGKSDDFHYPSQSGFGWTNAIFFRYIKLLTDIV